MKLSLKKFTSSVSGNDIYLNKGQIYNIRVVKYDLQDFEKTDLFMWFPVYDPNKGGI